MIGLLGIASIIALTTVIAGCSGGGGYGAVPGSAGDGGGYGGGGSAGGAQPGTARPSLVVAPSITPAAASTGAGRDRYGYGTPATTGPGAAGPGAGTVVLSGLAFKPPVITVTAGTDVAFSNNDSVGHVLVEGENGTPSSSSAAQSPVGPGQTLNLPFPKAGTFKITCTIHPSMNLTVTVTP